MTTSEQGKGHKPEWKAPRREYGGEDLQAYFAGMLADETVTMVTIVAIRQNRGILERIDELPIMQGFKEKVEDPCVVIEDRLKNRGLYQYEEDGSVFMDYKILRDKARKIVGEKLGETEPERAMTRGYVDFLDQFNVNSPIDQVLTKARDFVSTWEWSG